MNNDEIKQMLRELSDSAQAQGRVKSRTIRISLDRSEDEASSGKNAKRRRQRPKEEPVEEPAAEEAAASPEPERPAERLPRGMQEIHQEESGVEEEPEEEDLSDFSVLPKSSSPVRRRPAGSTAAGSREPAEDRTPENSPSTAENDTPDTEEAQTASRDDSQEPQDAVQGEETENRAAALLKAAAGGLGGLRSKWQDRRSKYMQSLQDPEDDSEDSPEDNSDESGDDAEGSGIPGAGEEAAAEKEPKPVAEEASGQVPAAVGEAVDPAVSDAKAETDTKTVTESKAEPEIQTAVKTEPVTETDASVQASTAGTKEVPEAETPETELSAQPETDTAEKKTDSSGQETGRTETASAADSGSDKERTRRKAPLEPADFESDADDFRSAAAPEARTPEERGSLRDRFRAYMTMLEGKGIGRREQLMLLAGLILLLLIVIIGMSLFAAHQKSIGVTADEGLTVTVESQPADWTPSASVTLGIRTSSPIQSVAVNGDNCDVTVGSTRTNIQLEADTPQLEVMVVTEENVLNAAVEIAKIDSQSPEVTLSSDGSLVTIEAEDDRSGVAAVYYGEIVGFSDVPAYQLYTEPFAAESGSLYAYYAVDEAGNMTGPVTTDMTPAEAIELSDTSLSLFPGDTAQISAQTTPANAFVNSLDWTVSDDSVISLEGGVVTALADGEADITVSAAGVASAVCHVTVRSSAQVTISTVGDMTLGDDVNFSPLNSFSTVATLNGTDYFLENVRDIFEADDITFANLEGTLTDQGTRQDKTYAFRGDPSYTAILTSGSVEAVTLANNHSSDYGEESLTDTENNLTEAGIDYCIGDTVIVREAGGIQVGLIGIYALDGTQSELENQVAETIDSARRQGAEVIVVAFHWGTESSESPDELQQTLAHTAVDNGADLVVGHHPHVLQGIEIYEGKYIVYSLGNFCFGGNSNPADMDTMIFQATFEMARTGEVSVSGVNIIPCSISSDSSWNNYQPTPAQGEEAQRIMDKINERSEAFGTPDFTYEG